MERHQGEWPVSVVAVAARGRRRNVSRRAVVTVLAVPWENRVTCTASQPTALTCRPVTDVTSHTHPNQVVVVVVDW